MAPSRTDGLTGNHDCLAASARQGLAKWIIPCCLALVTAAASSLPASIVEVPTLDAAAASSAATCAGSAPTSRDHSLLQSGTRLEALRLQVGSLKSPGQALIDFALAKQPGHEPPPQSGSAEEAWNLWIKVMGFFASVSSSFAMCVGCIVLFSFLRVQFPLVYAFYTLRESQSMLLDEYRTMSTTDVAMRSSSLPAGWLTPTPTLMGWLKATRQITLDEVQERAGLDSAQLIEFTHFCMQVMATLGVPMLVFVCPVEYYYGRLNPLMVEGVKGKSDPVICWVLAVAVWFVVVATMWMIFEKQGRFVERRLKWMLQIPAPRATTVLVENIPEDLRSDDRLKQYFDEELFQQEVVTAAYVVRRTSPGFARKLEAARLAKEQADQAHFQFKSKGKRPLFFDRSTGGEVDSIGHFEEEGRLATQELHEARREINHAVRNHESSVFCSNGFVTFKKRYHAAMAVQMNIRPDEDELVVSVPPDPSEVIWSDLQLDRNSLLGRRICGYALVAQLFLGYAWFVWRLPSITDLDRLRSNVAIVDAIMRRQPSLAAVWDGLVPSTLLSLAMGYVPTVLALIFNNLFNLKSKSWCQQEVQQWYFAFQVVFVVLVFTVSSSFNEAFATYASILRMPVKFFTTVTARLPDNSTFYLKYVAVQWGVLGFEFLRLPQIAKFLFYRTMYEEEVARDRSEPEDEDYDGIGARTARLSLLAIIGLVFSTVCPLVSWLCVFAFVVARYVYAYLVVYAECRKPDSGGVFWCAQLQHIVLGIYLYISMMVGILLLQSDANGPALFAGSSFLFVILASNRLNRRFRWEHLPFSEITKQDLADTTGVHVRRGVYRQPELTDTSGLL